jgi:hypothetical protein
MKKFCILTLTHESLNRPTYLRDTVDSFLNNTEVDQVIDWFIYINKTNQEFISVCNELIDKYKDKVDFKIVHSNVNNGVGYGINRLNDLSIDYEYSLFLEGDWKCMSPDISGQPKTWLKTSIELLDENQDTDAVFLRRYINDYESRSTGIFAYYSVKNCKVESKNGLKYFIVPVNLYTNNPLIRRNKYFYDNKTFPLQEFFDSDGNPTELKIDNITHNDWGQAEIKAQPTDKKIKYIMLVWGNFCHIDNIGEFDKQNQKFIEQESKSGCKKYNNGQSKCKFGYYNISPHFCILCSKTFSELEIENVFAKESYLLDTLEINKNEWTKEQKLKFIKDQNLTPEFDLEPFINYLI